MVAPQPTSNICMKLITDKSRERKIVLHTAIPKPCNAMLTTDLTSSSFDTGSDNGCGKKTAKVSLDVNGRSL